MVVSHLLYQLSYGRATRKLPTGAPRRHAPGPRRGLDDAGAGHRLRAFSRRGAIFSRRDVESLERRGPVRRDRLLGGNELNFAGANGVVEPVLDSVLGVVPVRVLRIELGGAALVGFGPEVARVAGASQLERYEVVELGARRRCGILVGRLRAVLELFGHRLGRADARRVTARAADGGADVGLGDRRVHGTGGARRVRQQVTVRGGAVAARAGTRDWTLQPGGGPARAVGDDERGPRGGRRRPGRGRSGSRSHRVG